MWNRATPCWKGAATPAGRRALQGAGRRGCRGEKMPSEVICSRGLGPREPTLQAGGSRARAQGEAAPPVRAATKNRRGNKRENGGRPRKGREGGRPPPPAHNHPLPTLRPPFARTGLSTCGDGTTHVDIAHIHGLGDATWQWPDFGPMALDQRTRRKMNATWRSHLIGGIIVDHLQPPIVESQKAK